MTIWQVVSIFAGMIIGWGARGLWINYVVLRKQIELTSHYIELRDVEAAKASLHKSIGMLMALGGSQ